MPVDTARLQAGIDPMPADTAPRQAASTRCRPTPLGCKLHQPTAGQHRFAAS
jgi:hypothetical protein